MMDASIVRLAGQKLTYYVTLLYPLPLIHAPYCDLTAESHTRSEVPVSTCCNMMTSKSMRFFKRLVEGKVRISSRIDFD